MMMNSKEKKLIAKQKKEDGGGSSLTCSKHNIKLKVYRIGKDRAEVACIFCHPELFK